MKIIATAHGSSLTDTKKRNEIGDMMGAGVFEKYIILSCEKGPGTLEEVIYQEKQVVG